MGAHGIAVYVNSLCDIMVFVISRCDVVVSSWSAVFGNFGLQYMVKITNFFRVFRYSSVFQNTLLLTVVSNFNFRCGIMVFLFF